MDKKNAVIIDLDGTLCNITNRKHFVEGEEKDWKNFYFNLSWDTANEWCSKLVLAMHQAGYHIVFVSGRPDDHREATLNWLLEHFTEEKMKEIKPSLFMRKAGDHRQDYKVKKELYETSVQPLYNVLFAVDDRTQVVQGWRELGLVCLQCAEGNY